MAKKDNPNLIFRREWWDNLRHKSPELFKESLSILFSTYFDGKVFDPYFFDEQGSNPTPAEDLAAPMVKAALSDRDTYIAKCNRLSANARKANQSETFENKCKQMISNDFKCEQMQGNIIECNVREGNIKEDMSTDVLLSTGVDDRPLKTLPFDYKSIQDGWNSITLLSKVVRLTDERRHKIRMRDAEIKEAGYSWQTLFDKISTTPFLLGQNKNNWKATLDWLVSNKENWLKVIEGNYDKLHTAYGTQQQTSQEEIAQAISVGFNSAKGTDQ